MIKVLDHGYVDYKYGWGSDESVIEAARMSTNKGFQGWGTPHLDTCAAHPMHNSFGACVCDQFSVGDEKLLAYLYNNKHMTPFEMAGATVEMQLPIFVAREFIRHRTFSFNELSGRYAELPNLYYTPSLERIKSGGQSKSNKQSSGESISDEDARWIQFEIGNQTTAARESYDALLNTGLSRELARVVIPVNQYTRWRMSGNLRNWLQMLELRLPENVQWETRQYANAVATCVQEHFPRTYALFEEGR